jgi:hypothetical protein
MKKSFAGLVALAFVALAVPAQSQANSEPERRVFCEKFDQVVNVALVEQERGVPREQAVAIVNLALEDNRGAPCMYTASVAARIRSAGAIWFRGKEFAVDQVAVDSGIGRHAFVLYTYERK